MKIIEDFDITLLEDEHDFDYVTEEGLEGRYQYTALWGGFDYQFEEKYAKKVASGRRGQEYYILIDPLSREISIYSTTPDGGGCSGQMNDTLLQLFQRGLIE